MRLDLDQPMRADGHDEPTLPAGTEIFGRVVATFPVAAPPYAAYAQHRTVVMIGGRPST